jgi:hypothetical protein
MKREEMQEYPYLVKGWDILGRPSDILIKATTADEAVSRVSVLAKKGELKNQFDRQVVGPFKARKITWERAEEYLKTLEDKYPDLFLLDKSSSAFSAVRDSASPSGWLVSLDRTYEVDPFFPSKVKEQGGTLHIPYEEGVIRYFPKQSIMGSSLTNILIDSTNQPRYDSRGYDSSEDGPAGSLT